MCRSLRSLGERFQCQSMPGQVLRPGDLDTCPSTSRGAFRAELSQVGVGDFLLGHAAFSRKLHQFGQPPRNGWTFVIPNHPDMRLLWRGHQLRRNHIMCFPLNSELESISHGCFDMQMLTVSDAYLNRKLEQMELPISILHGRELCEVDDRMIMAMCVQLRGIHKLSSSRLLADAERLQVQLDGLLECIIKSWAVSGVVRRSRGVLSKRTRMIASAVDYIRSHQHLPIRMADLCAHVGVSERTLQYQFQRQFQATPKQYIQAWRLHGLRKVMREQPQAMIGDHASAYGFGHLGQLSADYKAMFGELPSKTLARLNV